MNGVKTTVGVLKTWSCHTFSESDHLVRLKVSTRQVHKESAYRVDEFCGHCNAVFEGMGYYYHSRTCHEARSAVTEEKIQPGFGKKEPDELRKQYIQEKVVTSMRCTKVTRGKRKTQKKLLKSTCANLFLSKRLSDKNDFCKMSNLEVDLVMFNVIVKYTRISEKLLPIFHPSSRIQC